MSIIRVCVGVHRRRGGLWDCPRSRHQRAADMPVKAVPVPAVTNWVLDVHGYLDVTFASTRVTGGGLPALPDGFTLTQIDQSAFRWTSIRTRPASSTSFIVYRRHLERVLEAIRLRACVTGRRSTGGPGSASASPSTGRSAPSTAVPFPGGLPTAYNYNFTLALQRQLPGTGRSSSIRMSRCSTTHRAGRPSFSARRARAYRVDARHESDDRFSEAQRHSVDDIGPRPRLCSPRRNSGTGTTARPISAAPTSTLPCALNNVGFVTTGIQAKYTLEASSRSGSALGT